MNRTEKELAGVLYYLVSDKRKRVLLEDHLIFLEEKFREIRKLMRLFDRIDFDGTEKTAKRIINDMRKAKKAKK